MIQLRELIGFPNLDWHIQNKRSLSENVYRYSSKSFLSLFSEARKALLEGAISLSEEDERLIRETDIGLYGIYEGEQVPLDIPMEYEDMYEPILEDIQTYSNIYEKVNINNSYKVDVESINNLAAEFIFTDKHGIKRKLNHYKGGSIKLQWFNPETQQWSVDDVPRKYEDELVMNTFGKILVKAILPKFGGFTFTAINSARYRLFRALVYNNLDTNEYQMDYNDDTLEIEVYRMLSEAKYQGKDVGLNKPKRGGSKKFYVYTKNPKTGKVIKVSFGAEGGGQNLAVKFKEPGARASFAARHKCSTRKDKTKASYWSCRLPRYWKQLGGDKNYSGFW